MLAGKRAVRVGDKIKREIALLILERVQDPRVGGVTVTDIRLSDDLKAARVYYSVMGDRARVERAQAGLDSARSFMKRQIGSRMKLRYVPEITFVHDPSLETGSQMEAVFRKLRDSESNDTSE